MGIILQNILLFFLVAFNITLSIGSIVDYCKAKTPKEFIRSLFFSSLNLGIGLAVIYIIIIGA